MNIRYHFTLPFSLLLLLVLALTAVPEGTYAQSDHDEEPVFEQFKQNLKNDYLSVSALLQTVGDYQYERNSGFNGFSIGNARLAISGEFDRGFGYKLQTNVIKAAPVLDANVYYRSSPGFGVTAGLFKSPFSYEYLTGAAAIDFVNRATMVNQLAPQRQVGVQVSGETKDGILQYSLGAFNGNGFGINRNSDDQMLYVGRLEARFDTDRGQSSDQIIFGVNASREIKDQVATSGNIRSTFMGEQMLLGTDVRITQGRLFLAGEFIYSWLEENGGNNRQFNPFGYHATAGYYVTSNTQLLVRWDYFDGATLAPGSESVLAGINIFPTRISEIQLNYVIPTERPVEFSQVLLNLQVSI
ncbi:MAG: porin [Balneolaceae bacterium]|nr:porin [Balneolaceae bacterium]